MLSSLKSLSELSTSTLRSTRHRYRPENTTPLSLHYSKLLRSPVSTNRTGARHSLPKDEERLGDHDSDCGAVPLLPNDRARAHRKYTNRSKQSPDDLPSGAYPAPEPSFTGRRDVCCWSLDSGTGRGGDAEVALTIYSSA